MLKVKQPITGPGGSRRPRPQISRQSRHEGDKVVNPTYWTSLALSPKRNNHDTHVCWSMNWPQVHNVTGRITLMKNSNDTIGNQNPRHSGF